MKGILAVIIALILIVIGIFAYFYFQPSTDPETKTWTYIVQPGEFEEFEITQEMINTVGSDNSFIFFDSLNGQADGECFIYYLDENDNYFIWTPGDAYSNLLTVEPSDNHDGYYGLAVNIGVTGAVTLVIGG